MADNKFKIRIIAPNRLFLEDEIDMLEFVTTEGAMGIYKNHVPTTVILKPCVLSMHKDGEINKCMVSGGFIEILQDKVTVMAEDVLSADEVDYKRAEAAKERARKIIADKQPDMDMIRAQASLDRAIARLLLRKN